MSLELNKKPCRITHINVREEMHGENAVTAVDITVKADMPNSFLDELSIGLRAALYRAEGEGAGETADVDKDHLSVLRFPQLGALAWADKLIGAKITLAGASKADKLDPMEFEADVNKVSLALKEGGTVETSFRIQFLPEPNEIGWIAGFLSKKAKVTIVAADLADTPPASTE